VNEHPSSADRELPPWAQLASLLGLWAIWIGVAIYVIAREQWLNENWRYYQDPALIYSLLFFWEPLPLVLLGMMYLRRSSPEMRRPYRVTRILVRVITLLGAFAVWLGIAASLMLPGCVYRVRD
jgi:hypothetical protein